MQLNYVRRVQMQRNYEIKTNKQEIGEEQDEEDLHPVSLYLGQKHLDFLESFETGSRSETLRRILEWFREKEFGFSESAAKQKVKEDE